MEREALKPVPETANEEELKAALLTLKPSFRCLCGALIDQPEPHPGFSGITHAQYQCPDCLDVEEERMALARQRQEEDERRYGR